MIDWDFDNTDLLKKEYLALEEKYLKLKSENKRLWTALLKHYKPVGHDRCQINDKELYKEIGLPEKDFEFPCREEFLRGCANYYDHQNPSNQSLPNAEGTN